jgi:cytoskeletal protein CcmA (bactofilin family)
MFKTNGLGKDKSAAVPQAADRDVKSASTPVSCIGSAMKIVGNVECCAPAQVFGTIEGELRATELVIGEGGRVEGSIQAEDVTVNGRVKGTIRASRVRLQGATVEGDIIHRTLSIDESSVFNGMSRRVENPVERRADATADSLSNAADGAAPKKVIPSPPLVPSTVSMTNGRLQPN